MAKQLKQLLQEKQEPFILELYLVEKGYLRNTFNSIDHRRRKGIPKCSKLLRGFYNQVISLNYRLKIKSTSSPRNHVAENNISTVFDSCNGSDSEEMSSTTSQKKRTEHEVVTDGKLQCQCIEERTNSSSIRKENGENTTCTTLSPKKVTEDSILSASLCKILFQSAREKTLTPGVPEIQGLLHSQQRKSKKVLQQTRQLLFDCVREIVETQEKKQQTTKHLATHEFGKLIEEKIKCWGKQCGEESKLEYLLELEFRDSAHEWIRTGYKPQQGRKIGCEIGDAIFDELMNEIVMDMVGF